MFERTKKDIEKALVYCEQLIKAPIYDPKNINIVDVPEAIGVYLWRVKKDNKVIVYVGRALGTRGLRQRIVKQHLSRSYSSVFKRRIAKEHGLNRKEETLGFLANNFSFSFVTVSHDEEKIARLAEDLLINEYSPKYNTHTQPF